MSIKVLQLSPTPLVAAPGKLSSALRQAGHDSLSVAFSDYPASGSLNGKFIGDTTVYAEASDETRDMINEFAKTADIIHVHNDLSATNIQWLRELAPRAAFVYQVHSPLREGPLYFNRSEHMGLPFRAKLAVGQYQPRHYPDFIAVPNLVLDAPHLKRRQPKEKLRILFSPSHSRTGRWNAKYSASLETILKSLVALNRVEVIWPTKPIAPTTLMAIRRTCHVSIDEIVTGAFHQVSIEGLCAGNVVINRADFFSKAMMAQCAGSTQFPPFVQADETNVAEVLLDLAASPEKTAEIQQASHDYFRKNLTSGNLVKRFEKIYENIQ